MTRVNTAIAPLFIMAFLVVAGAFTADAAIKSPTCPELVALGQEIAPGQVVPINDTPSRFTIPAAFAGPRFEQLFGAPALAWSQDDVLAAIKVTGDCATAAKKARNKAEIGALTTLWKSFGGLRATLGAVAATEPKIDAWLKVLLEDAPSRATLDALVIAGSARDAGPETMQRTAKELKDSSIRLNVWDPAHSHAQGLLKTLSDAPSGSWARVFPPIDNRIVEVRQWVIDDVNAQIDATPATVQGLKKLDPLAAKSKSDLAATLSEADLAKFDETAKARHEAIENALLAEEEARIAAAPATVEGLNQLRMAQQSPVKEVLSPERVAALDGKIAARREEIGGVVTDEQIKGLDAFPATLAGLSDLDNFKSGTMRGLEALVGPAAAAKFGEAATKRATSIGEQAFDPFREALGEMPATEEGLAEFDNALKEVEGPVSGLETPLRDRYVEAAAERRAEIVAAVEKEDARLAKLPLSGGVFTDRETGAKLEFRDRSRVYLTIFNETTEAQYEVDGDRVIIRMPTANQVFTRQGAWIRGSDLNFKRQAEK